MDELARKLGGDNEEFFTAMAESINKTEEKLGGTVELNAEMLKRFESFNERIEEVSVKVEYMRSDLSEVEKRISKLETKFLETEGRSPRSVETRKKRRVMSMDEEEDEEEVEDEELEPVSKVPPREEFVIGNRVDVKALLSTKACNFLVTTKAGETVPIATLDGKYVLVCCFRVPFETDDIEACFVQSLEALYHELSIKGIVDTVKLVVVAKIDTGFCKADFDNFFSTLSLDCLTIPFSDSVSRDKVCESLNLTRRCGSRWVACLAVHPDGTVLQINPLFLLDHGADSFPFTEEHIDDISDRDETMRDRVRSTDSPISVRELLQCEYLSRIDDERSLVSTVSLCNNRDTVVALYLYYEGDFMAELREIHKKCIDQGHKFEIVLVPLPFDRHYDPASFYNRMIQSASEDDTSSSWLVFPFDDKICRTLWRLYYCYPNDKLIIMPQSERPGDLWGRHIASSYGIVAYPFTREDVVRIKVTEDMPESEILRELEDDAQSA